MSKQNKYPKISELSDDQRSHLAWRLDNKTFVGMVTAAKIARGEHGDDNIVDVFIKADMSERSAKIHARKVMNFDRMEYAKKNLSEEEFRIFQIGGTEALVQHQMMKEYGFKNK